MKRLTAILFSGALAVLLASPLLAQNISVVSGNGQLIAPACTLSIGLEANAFTTFEPMAVVVTDNTGKPVSGATVTWTVTSGTGTLGASSTTTDVNGMTNNTFVSAGVAASGSYLQSQVTAATTTASVVFYLTQTSITNFLTCTFSVQTAVTSPSAGTTIGGNAGGTGSPAITATVTAAGTAVPNVSVRLFNSQDQQGLSLPPAAACATGAGADRGSVLTDVNGNATCTPILQSSAGSGSVYAGFGGVAMASSANGSQFQGGPIYYSASGSFPVQVTAATPGAINITGGNNQSANPGQALPVALTAQVVAVGGGAIAGLAVNWSVTPSGAATLSPVTSTSDVNGTVSTMVTLSSSAVGPIQVKAALVGNPGISATFMETANSLVSGIQIVSGNNNQTAVVNTAFSQPLIVQVNGTSGQPLANATVQFSITGTGAGTLSAASATSGSNGQAGVTVTAGATPGPITVTAMVGGQSVSFSLTAVSPLSSANFYNAAGLYTTDSSHSALTPCGITAIIAPGLAPAVQGVVAPETFGVLPYQVANVAITVGSSQAPIYSVSNINGQQQVNFQVPCGVTVAPGGSMVPVVVTVNGASTMVNVTVRSAGPGIFETVMSDGTRQAIIIRPDGSLMDSVNNPVRPGEIVIMLVTGIGPTAPPVSTNSVPAPGVTANATGQVIVGVNNAGVPVVSAQLSPDIVGVAQVTFQVPATTTTGTYVLSMGVNAPDGTSTQFSQGSKITVHQ